MRKIILSLIAISYFGLNGYSQDKMDVDPINLTTTENTHDASVKLSCTKINVGINILIAWASVDVYIGCGFPPDHLFPTGCKPISEKMCKIIEDMNQRENDYGLNIKDFFPGVDCSHVTELEITKSDEWLDDSGQTVTIRLGKYKVDPQGNFILEIVKKG